MLMPELLV